MSIIRKIAEAAVRGRDGFHLDIYEAEGIVRAALREAERLGYTLEPTQIHERPRASDMSILQRLYDSEINCGVQTVWDRGFGVWVGDDFNGVKEHHRFGTWSECEFWLDRTARELYPNSKYARGE